MAWGVLTMGREARERLAVVLRALLIAQLVASLCMLIFCYNASRRVMALLMNIHKVTVMLLYGLILVHAYCLKLHYTSGLRLVTWLLKLSHWPRCAALTRLWTASGSLVAANGILVYAACSATMKALMKELSTSLRVGISQYLTEPSWKRLLDTMQVELSCCGAEKASDWHEIPWINMDFLNEDSELVMKLNGQHDHDPNQDSVHSWVSLRRMAGSDGKILPPSAPYSCCSPRLLAACYHDPLQQVGSWELGLASLQARGCVDAVRGPLARTLLALQCCTLLLAVIQVVIVALSRLLASSARDAALRGEPRGPGRAALFAAPTPSRVQRRASSELGGGRARGGCASPSAFALERRRR